MDRQTERHRDRDKQYTKDCNIPYKTIYWRGINISNWRFFRKFTNIKYTNINKKGERQMDIQTETERQSQRQTEQVRGNKGERERDRNMQRQRQKKRERERGKIMQIKRQTNEKIIFFKM